jgi:flagellar export protein FliJ
MTTKAWSIIDQLAKDKLNEARDNVSLANQALQKVTAQKLQLFEMLNDYQSRLSKSQETKHSIDEHVSYRHFIKQVQDLIEVIEKEEHQAELRLQSEEDKLIDALKEKKKTEFLIERDNSLAIKRNQVLEQKGFDELGISRFNQR